MSAPDLPLWAALIVAVLVVLGAGFTLVGSLGLLRLRTFYERAHASTMGTSAGIIATALASILTFSVLGSRIALHELLIFIFVILTTPVTLILLTRAALFRDRVEGTKGVPGRLPAPPPQDAKAGESGT